MVARHHAEAQVPVGQACILGDDADVGHQRDREPRADGGAVDRRDDRLLAVEHVEHEVGGLGGHPRYRGVIARHLLEHLQVAARRERAPGTGDDGDLRGIVGGDVAPHP